VILRQLPSSLCLGYCVPAWLLIGTGSYYSQVYHARQGQEILRSADEQRDRIELESPERLKQIEQEHRKYLESLFPVAAPDPAK